MTILDISDSRFRCCLYLHVRTGTIILGILHILLQLIVISSILVATLRQDSATVKSPLSTESLTNCAKKPSDVMFMMMHMVPGFTIFHRSHSDFSSRIFDGKSDDSDKSILEHNNNIFNQIADLPPDVDAPVPVLDPSNVKFTASSALNEHRCYGRQANPYFSLCIAIMSLSFGYLLIQGVLSRQPAHLLPFFCLLVFDFVVALICMLGYMSSASDIGNWVKQRINQSPNFKDHPINLNPTSVAVVMIATSCIILAFKAYCIGMVWDCHRYLILTNRSSQLGFTPQSSRPGFSFLWSGLFRRPSVHPSVGPQRDAFVGDIHDGNDVTSIIFGAVPTKPPADSSLPKYEEALETPANAYAPPPYFVKTDKTNGELEEAKGQQP